MHYVTGQIWFIPESAWGVY